MSLADIAAIMTDAGEPMGASAVSRHLDAAILRCLPLIADRAFDRPITREELELRAKDPESWRRIKDAFGEFLLRG